MSATARIRNVAVIGAHGVGKTTLVESMLFDMGMIPQRGRVETGNAATDFDSEEILRQMSVQTGIASGEWRDCALNFLDVPGSHDFSTDAKLAMAAADAALLVINAAKGVDANTRKAFEAARELELPVLVFINGVDQDTAKPYPAILQEIHERLSPHAVPLELPVGEGRTFKGDVDLIGLKTWYFAPETGEVTEVPNTPPELTELVQRYHTTLVEGVAELHDEVLERYLGGQEPEQAELSRLLRADLLDNKLLPVLCGSALGNAGVRPLLDAIVNLVPSPADRRYPSLLDLDTQAQVPLKPETEGPLVAVVLKTFSDPYLGKISVFKVLSGSLASDAHLTNAQRQTPERMGRLFKLVGKKQLPVERLVAGDIGGTTKLKETQTGDTLVTEGHPPRRLAYPMPTPAAAIWSVAISPAAKNDEAKLAIALSKLKEEDPALTVSVEGRTHRTVLSGQGPTHLEVVLAKLANRFNLEVKQSEPEVPYRETIAGRAQGQGKHKKQTGGRGQYGDVWLKIEPLPRGTGFKFVDAVVGGAVPRNFIPAVEKGVRETLEQGLLAGYPIVDVKVTLYDGSSHSVDSSEMAFKTAANLAMRKVFAEAQPLLLEPVLDVSISAPEEALGDVMGDLNGRRAHIEGMDGSSIHAKVPLAELAGLVTAVQSITRGQGALESSFSHYQEVPGHLQAKLLTGLKAETAPH
ncbi:elongation factor G [bacterium]|nr:elongation factor G [bacterium]